MLIEWAKAVTTHSRTSKLQKKEPDEPKEWLRRVGLVAGDEMRAVENLWEAYTTERSKVGRYLSDPKAEAMAYGLGFHLANTARLWGMMQRLQLNHFFSPDIPIRLYDLGCGTGAITHSFLNYLRFQEFKPKALAIELVDARDAFLDFCKTLLQSFENEHTTFISRKQRLDVWTERTLQNIPKPDPDKPYVNVVFLGYVLNELLRDKRTQNSLKKLLKHPAFRDQPTLVFILDSANENISREIMSTRDDLVASGYQVLYPCPHQSSCPMLSEGKDWCYSEFLWKQPPEQQKIDKRLKLHRDKVSASAYVFASQAALKQSTGIYSGRPHPIIVGRPLLPTPRRGEQKMQIVTCAPDGTLQREKPIATNRDELPQHLRGLISENL